MKFFKKIRNFCEKYHIISVFSDNKVLILFLLILFLGMLVGTYSIDVLSAESVKKFGKLISFDFKIQHQKTPSEIFMESFLTIILFAFFEFFCAFSIFGIILIPLILMFRGFSIGLLSGYLYLSYGLKGIGYYTLILFPSLFFSSVGLVLFTIESTKLTKVYSRILYSSQQYDEPFRVHVLKYAKKCGGITILFFISSGIQALFFSLFSKFFAF